MELNSNHPQDDSETVGVNDFTTIAAAEGVVDFRIDFQCDRMRAAVAQRELSETDMGSREPFVIAIELVWTKLIFEQHHVHHAFERQSGDAERTVFRAFQTR